MKKFLCAMVFTVATVGFAVADTEISAVITGVKDGKVTYKEKMGKKKFGDEKSADTVAAKSLVVKYGTFKFDKADKKFNVTAGDDVEGGLDAKVVKDATVDAPVGAFIYIDDDDKSDTKGKIKKIIMQKPK